MWTARKYIENDAADFVYNFLSHDQRNKTEAPDPGEGPYQPCSF